MTRNLVLDWSGTLVDDLDAVLGATNAVLEEYRVPKLTVQQFRTEFVLPLSRFYGRFVPGVPFVQIDERYHKHFASYRDSVSLLPGAREFLNYCAEAGMHLFVLSTMQPELFDAQAARLGIRHYFTRAYTGVKDKTETILSLLEQNQLEPAETMLVGDMVHDLEAARQGGLMAVAVRTGFDTVEKLAGNDPEAIVRDLISLRRLLEKDKTNAFKEWLEIADLEVQSRIGVPDDERAKFQRLLVSLRFQIRSGFAALNDRFESTVDYASVASEASRIAETAECQLVETLAAEIADALMVRFPMRRLEVELKKLILPNARHVSVTTTRRR
jgi:phosphoglycolate phosphatase